MLVISSPLIAVALMQFCIVLLRINLRLDVLNGPTTRPFTGGEPDLGMTQTSFKRIFLALQILLRGAAGWLAAE